MIRGYDSWVWFAALYVPILTPKIVRMLLINAIYIIQWVSWCCCKGWCFRVLQGGYVLYPTRAARVLVKGAAARCRVLLSDFSQKQQDPWRMVAKKRAHKTQVLILQMYQGSELGSLRYDSGMIRAWFGVWFGNPSFFEFRKLCCLSLFFPPSTYYDCYFVNGSCTFSSATLRLMFLFDGVLVWLPASQPASQPASHPEPASLGIMMRLCARGEDSPTLVN